MSRWALVLLCGLLLAGLADAHGGTQYFLDQLRLPEELRSNITTAYYEAGHMMYIHKDSMAKFKADLREFIAQ